MEFNEKLQYFRKKSNLTQEELAEKLFVYNCILEII